MAATAVERSAFADTLSAVGPDAPTLAGGWTAADLAAHVAGLDALAGVPTFVGRSLVARGVRLNDVAGRAADRAVERNRRRGFDWALDVLRSPIPRLLRRPSVAPIGLFEVYAHHEDVLRVPGVDVRRSAPPPAELDAVLTWLRRYHGRRLDGVRIEGTDAEVVLALAGRPADVTIAADGDGGVPDFRI